MSGGAELSKFQMVGFSQLPHWEHCLVKKRRRKSNIELIN
jgi:hypothetical protein